MCYPSEVLNWVQIISGLVLQGTAADYDLPVSLCRELWFSQLLLPPSLVGMAVAGRTSVIIIMIWVKLMSDSDNVCDETEKVKGAVACQQWDTGIWWSDDEVRLLQWWWCRANQSNLVSCSHTTHCACAGEDTRIFPPRPIKTFRERNNL